MSDTIDWRRARKMLGVIQDKDIAKMLGCTRAAVQWKRTQLGISAVGRHATNREVMSMIASDGALGEVRDTVLANRYGVDPGRVHRARRAAHVQTKDATERSRVLSHPLIGVAVDRVIAVDMGIDPQKVQRHRSEAGIAAPGKRTKTPRRRAVP